MDERATLKVSRQTAAQLRAVMPQLCAEANRMLTIDTAITWLIEHRAAQSPFATSRDGD